MNIKLQKKTDLRAAFSRSNRALFETRKEVFKQHYATFRSKRIPMQSKQRILEELAKQMQEMGHYSPNTDRQDVKFSIIRQCFRTQVEIEGGYENSTFAWSDYCNDVGFNPYGRVFA